MAVTWKDDTGHTLATSPTLTTLLTFSANAIPGGAKVLGVTCVNSGAVDRLVLIYLVESGGAAADGKLIFYDTVPAKSTVPCPGGPWPASASAFVQGTQIAGADVVVRVHAFEET